MISEIGTVRQNATANVDNAVFCLVVAFLLVLLFSVFYIILNKNKKVSKKVSSLPILFVISLAASQYVLFLYGLILKGVVGSGVSLFIVDSLATMLVLAFLNMLLFFKFFWVRLLAKFKMPAKSVSKLKKLSIFVAELASSILAIILLLMIALLALFDLSSNLGLLNYNPSFSSAYHVHAYGIILFAISFYFFFYRELGDAIRKIIKTYKRGKRLAS